MNQNLKIFSGTNSTSLAQLTTEGENPLRLGNIYHHKFPSNEHYVQFQENIRGCDVFLIQSAFGTMYSNDSLMQLLIMADAARRASAKRITAICPLFFYQRQDRKDKPRVPISAKLVMNLLEAAGINRILTMDLHAPQIAGFTDLPFDHLNFRPTLINSISHLNIEVVVAPDIGGVKRAEEYARKMNCDLGFISKKRMSDTKVEVSQFVGDVKGKNILIVDDLTESAGTMIAAATECKNNGASKVYGAVTHACLSPLGHSRIKRANEDKIIDHFYCSNTVTESFTGNDCISVISVAEIFKTSILNIHNNKSISSLFE